MNCGKECLEHQGGETVLYHVVAQGNQGPFDLLPKGVRVTLMSVVKEHDVNSKNNTVYVPLGNPVVLGPPFTAEGSGIQTIVGNNQIYGILTSVS